VSGIYISTADDLVKDLLQKCVDKPQKSTQRTRLVGLLKGGEGVVWMLVSSKSLSDLSLSGFGLKNVDDTHCACCEEAGRVCLAPVDSKETSDSKDGLTEPVVHRVRPMWT